MNPTMFRHPPAQPHAVNATVHLDDPLAQLNPAGPLLVRSSRRWSWLSLLGPGIIALPSVYYLYVLNFSLKPIEYPDAVSYLWAGPWNLYYLTGRSLTQRAIYTLLDNHLQLIVNLQLTLLAATALIIYLLFQTQGPVTNLVVAVLVAFSFSSYSLSSSPWVSGLSPYTSPYCFSFISCSSGAITSGVLSSSG
jgi:hypothetical protein